MATSSDAKATQTGEEEKEDYSHVTENNINFKHAEGIEARLHKFKVVSKKGFIVQLELNGAMYQGYFIEAVDSFAPVNFFASKRRPRVYKQSKVRQYDVKRTKKYTNVYSRENYPQGYVDTFNTVEARLRYGRDKKVPGFQASSSGENSSSQSSASEVLRKSNRKKRLQCIADAFESDDSPIRERKNKTKCRNLKGSQHLSECEKVSEAISNANSLHTSSVLMAASTPIYDTPKNHNQDKVMCGSSIGTFSASETKIQRNRSKNKEKQITANGFDNMTKGKDLDQHNSVPGLTTSIRKRNNKVQSKNGDGVQRATSSKVSCSSSESDLITFSPEGNLISLSPEENSGKQHEKNCDIVESVTLNKPTSSQSTVSNLITFGPEGNKIFSPEENIGKQCEKSSDIVECVTLNKPTSSQSSVSNLISLNPEVSTETQCTKDVFKSPLVIRIPENKLGRLNQQFNSRDESTQSNNCIEISFTPSKTIFPKFSNKKLSHKNLDIKCVIEGENILSTNEKV